MYRKRTVYFVDASHFVLALFLSWVRCFVRLHVRAASGRQRYNVLGALNAVTHALVTEINTTYITATSVCALPHPPNDAAGADAPAARVPAPSTTGSVVAIEVGVRGCGELLALSLHR